MNPLTNIKNVQKMNERELELGLIGKKSWHDQYKDSAWVFIGGLPYDLTEGDIIAVFSQYGELVNINLVRDGKTGKSRGFCFLCYEDQRSTVLAVDNLNGIKLLGRTIRVDHVEKYKVPKEHGDEDEVTMKVRTEGIAPKVEEGSSISEEEDDYVIPLKKHKKEKKTKKKKKKNKKKEKKKSASDSDSSSKIPKKKKKIGDEIISRKRQHSEEQQQSQRQQAGIDRRKEGNRDYRGDTERSPVRQREYGRDRDSRHSPDRKRVRDNKYRDSSPRRRDMESPKQQALYPGRGRDRDYSPPSRFRDLSPKRHRSEGSPQRRDRSPRDSYRDRDSYNYRDSYRDRDSKRDRDRDSYIDKDSKRDRDRDSYRDRERDRRR